MRLRLLIAIAILPLLLWALIPLVSSGATNQTKLSDLQQKIEKTQGKIGRKKGTERVLSSDIAAWTAKINRLQGKIGSLQSRESAIQADLDGARSDLQRIQSDLRFQRSRQARLKVRLAVGRRLLSKRLVERYQADAPDIITVILNSNGFAQLLERSEFLKRINQQDERIIRTVASAKADATDNAQRLDKLEGRQQQVTARITSRRDAVASIKQELIDTRVGYDQTRQGKARALAGVKSERVKLEGSLSQMKATQAKIQGILSNPGGSLPAGPIRGGSGR